MRSPEARPRLLFVVYQYPPSAGGGAQRATKFTRYLAEDGWDITVLSADPLAGQPRDESLLAQVVGIPVVRTRPRHVAAAIARVLAPLKRVRSAPAVPQPIGSHIVDRPRQPLSGRISRWIAVPDDAVIWSHLLPQRIARLHKQTPFDVILATAPPYSALVAATRAGARFGIPVVCDMRDLWKSAFTATWPTAAHRRHSEALERRALSSAAAVVTASEAMEAEAREMGAARTEVIPNGFDSGEMPEWKPTADDALHLVFIGRLSFGSTDPTTLFESLARAREIDARVSCTLDILGPDAPRAVEFAHTLGIGDMVRFQGFRPYAEALAVVAKSDAGVMVFEDTPGSEGHYPGKMFDYLGIGVPLLVFGSERSGAAQVARESGCGHVVPAGDVDGGARLLLELAEAKRSALRPCVVDPAVRARFNRRDQVARLSALLHEVIGD